MKRQITEIEREIVERSTKLAVNVNGKVNGIEEKTDLMKSSSSVVDPSDIDLECLDPLSELFQNWTLSVFISQHLKDAYSNLKLL